MSLTVEEIRANRIYLEEQILKMISQFNKTNGVLVTSVDVTNYQSTTIDGARDFVMHNVKVTLEPL